MRALRPSAPRLRSVAGAGIRLPARRLPRRRNDLGRQKALLSASDLHGQSLPADHRRGGRRDASRNADERRKNPGKAPHNLVEINSYSNAWPCLFPQHGSGRKHERKIELADWQQAIVDREPEAFVRGLLHSEGCRVMNRVVVNGKDYAYPRYFFSQVSTDIQAIFCRALERLSIEYRFSSRGRDVSIARRESVARLDWFVGKKS